MQLHKAKGRQAFKVYAAVLEVGLMILFLTGFIMEWKISKYRRLLLDSAAMGILLYNIMLAIKYNIFSLTSKSILRLEKLKSPSLENVNLNLY